MAVPEHLNRFIELNTAARVVMLCRSIGKPDQRRVDFYIDAVKQAVLAEAAKGEKGVAELDSFLSEQLELLKVALSRPPVPRLPRREIEPEEELPPMGTVRSRRARRLPESSGPEAMSMEDKLEESRKPLRKILNEDCVRLGLLDIKRAEKLASRLAGKSREDAEAEIVAEIRNNLHQQVRAYLRKYKGGPWPSPKLQEELRVDIASTNSVHAVVTLTRFLLKERRNWETKMKKGKLGNLFGGKIRISN